MKALGIESSGMVASVAVVEDTQLLAEYTVNYKKTHSQTLLPMLDEIAKMTELDLSTLDLIAVSAGPGSFTGLRIGSATAKGLGLALDKPLVSVPTLEGMAYNLCCSDAVVCPMMDARRGNVYAGIYGFANGRMEILEDQMQIPVSELVEKLNACEKEVILMGDGADVNRALLEEKLCISHRYAPSHLSRQRASAVAELGILMAKEGKLEHARDHEPDYLRPSQAEREREERAAQVGKQ